MAGKKLDVTVGDVLSLDPGTAVSGVSLWRDGSLVATAALKSPNGYTSTVSGRLKGIVHQLNLLLDAHDAKVHIVICENPPHTLLKAVIGAMLVSPRVDSMFSDAHTVAVMSWKAWARARGAGGPFKDIKGVKALKATGFPVPQGIGDDEADSILVYLAYRDREKK